MCETSTLMISIVPAAQRLGIPTAGLGVVKNERSLAFSEIDVRLTERSIIVNCPLIYRILF